MEGLTVQVPASTANLGPGFDALGLALDLHNTITVERYSRREILVSGEGAGQISTLGDNLVYRAMGTVYRRVGEQVPPLRVHSHNRIPLARGLGSSAAAVAGGMVAANALLGGPLDREELLALGTEMEGHPDNLAPTLFGGAQVCVLSNGRVVHASIPVPPDLAVVLFVPDFAMSTAEARAVLPSSVPFSHAVYNLGRAALLVAALASGQVHLLREATRDLLHQPARQGLFPAMSALLDAALEAGALGAFLSGAGSTLAAFALDNAEQVKSAFEQAARQWGIAGTGRVTRINPGGAVVIAAV